MKKNAVIFLSRFIICMMGCLLNTMYASGTQVDLRFIPDENTMLHPSDKELSDRYRNYNVYIKEGYFIF